VLKASSLYIVIIVSVVIAILTASLISVAYFYRNEYQKALRYSRLAANLESGTDIMLAGKGANYDADKMVDLFNEGKDSLILRREAWGIYDQAIVKSFTLKDTLERAFLIAQDAGADKVAVYLSDEDRPLSVGGAAQITGDAVLPKAGVRSAYVDGKPYSGRRLVNGNIKISKRTLPALNSIVINRINAALNDTAHRGMRLGGSTRRSFFDNAVTYNLTGSIAYLGNISLQGKIILVSDTTVRIGRGAMLKDVIIFAPYIQVEEGFKGSCQLFARDSIVTGQGVVFEYPSAMGVMKRAGAKSQSKIELGQKSSFSGILFTYESSRSELQTIITLGKNSHIKGEVYSTGFIKLDKPVRIDGMVTCNRFIIRTQATLFENYLIDVSINRPARSKYYATSMLFTPDTMPGIVLKWLK
jgi:hypothetical protein